MAQILSVEVSQMTKYLLQTMSKALSLIVLVG